MNIKQTAQKGFTLIELMIVVAIIGILAAVAIPQYRDYTIKAKIGNALSSVDSIKAAVALCAQELGIAAGATPTGCDTDTNGIPKFTPTKEVQSASVTAGKITAKLAKNIGTDVDEKEITWTPTVGTSSLTWAVGTDVTQAAALEALKKNNVSS